MEITRQADYAVRAVLELALRPEGACVLSADLSLAQNIPAAFLTKICARLAAVGICLTQRGTHGGIRLSRPAEQISLLEVVEAIDGPITFNRCARQPGECARARTCAVHPNWLEVCATVRSQLARYTFAAMAAQAPGTARPKPAIRLYEELPIQHTT